MLSRGAALRGEWLGLPVADVLLAAALTLLGTASALTGHPDEGPAILTVPCALVMAGALAWRRRAPLLSLAAVLAGDLLQAYLAIPPGAIWSLAVLLVSAYSVGLCLDEVRSVIGITALVAALWVQEFHEHGQDYLFDLLVFGGAWLVGRAVRQWTDRATVAEESSEASTRAAVASERLTIARELHDIVAHHISVIAIQANAAEAALLSDPTLAGAPIRQIKTSATQSLEEMRRLLQLLRDDERGSPRPLPGLDQIEDLVSTTALAGLPVTLSRCGIRRALPSSVDLAAYRIVQESLTNVLRHAGLVPTTVELVYAPDEIAIHVRNGRGRLAHPRTGTGHGLIGLRERTLLMGGRLTAGPDSDGGYAVSAHLPNASPP